MNANPAVDLADECSRMARAIQRAESLEAELASRCAALEMERARSRHFERALERAVADDNVSKIAALHPKPGDVIVATVKETPMCSAFLESVGKGLEGIWPDHRIVVVPETVTVSVDGLAGAISRATGVVADAMTSLAGELRRVRDQERQVVDDEDGETLYQDTRPPHYSGGGVMGRVRPGTERAEDDRLVTAGAEMGIDLSAKVCECGERLARECDSLGECCKPGCDRPGCNYYGYTAADAARDDDGVSGEPVEPARCPVVSTAYGDLPVGTRAVGVGSHRPYTLELGGWNGTGPEGGTYIYGHSADGES